MGADPIIVYLARLKDQWEGWNAEEESVFTALYLATPSDKTQLDVALTALLRTIMPNGQKSPIAKKNESYNVAARHKSFRRGKIQESLPSALSTRPPTDQSDRGGIQRLATLHHNQRGFRAVDGVFLNTLTLKHIIKFRKANVKPYHLLFLDLTKAFDTVSHNFIERALRRFNVDPRMRGFIVGHILMPHQKSMSVVPPHPVASWLLARLGIVDDIEEIEILWLFLEDSCIDWYSSMLKKLLLDSEWIRWKEFFCETYADKSWTLVRYAISFKYIADSLLEYALKKETLIGDE
ncbi:hypothetical protein ILUMI_10320 [Ignelater luminosus]|uniref:Reverse transcriptase domain-containing protein n=1 Tax=Ignelater luminosus TaxID=2038154 RepID=A0A8K0GBK8_IGNLU|nr:hypothetical protein ILUMI_10320 [Ignelater luminosus]